MYIKVTAAKRPSVNATNCLLNLVFINFQFFATSVKRMHPAAAVIYFDPLEFFN